MSKEELVQAAVAVFTGKGNDRIEKLHVTGDGQAFTDEGAAASHSKSLGLFEEKDVVIFTRTKLTKEIAEAEKAIAQAIADHEAELAEQEKAAAEAVAAAEADALKKAEAESKKIVAQRVADEKAVAAKKAAAKK
jgi:hypothetical protein